MQDVAVVLVAALLCGSEADAVLRFALIRHSVCLLFKYKQWINGGNHLYAFLHMSTCLPRSFSKVTK